MKQQIRIEITKDGEVHIKTIGMNDEACLDFVPILEELLEAKTVHSEFTEEFLQAQQHITDQVQTEVKQQINTERD